MLKRMMSLLAVLVLCAGCACALAEDEAHTLNMPAMGLTFAFPQEYDSAKGWIGTDGVMEFYDGIYYMYLYYCAVPRDDFDRLYDENQAALMSKANVLFYVFAVGDGKDFSEVVNLTGGSLSEEGALKLGQEGAFSFYLYWTEDAGYAAAIGDEFGAEYTALCGLKDQVASRFTCYAPVNEYTGMEGAPIRFEATDLEGNPVSCEELFAAHEVTFVNIWATWCGPCVSELAELQAIHTRFLEKDCAVVGLLTDLDLDEARRLMEANGITYDVIVLTSNDLTFVFPYSGIPTSFFVDRNGCYLGTKFVGACPDQYEAALEPYLQH
ncbi:MAG: TlpA family protein disulfide reductase [Clostridia bacterium]|nr:TlpA family protein disulfide reductase [Clostridia bacterium]